MAVETVPLTAEWPQPRIRGYWPDAFRRLLKNRLSIVGLFILALFAVIAIFAPLVASHDPNAQDFAATFAEPSGDHLMGTDNLGRDWFSRLVYGARLSMTVGFFTQAIILSIGVPIGLLAGFLAARSTTF